MRFAVGPWVYKVAIFKGLTNDERKPVAGLCVWETHTVFIDADTPVRRRLQVLLHELKHAWQRSFGRPMDDEGDACMAASFTADVIRQLERQGGEQALIRLTPEGIVDGTADVDLPGEPRAAQCPSCSGLLNLPIRTGAPEFDPARNRLASRRSADCEFCGHTVVWAEAVTSSGVPTGQVFGDPEIEGRSARVA